MFLNEFQQGNAIPPFNNTEANYWDEWKTPLGDKAVLNGFNVFPINMAGADDDYLLNLNVDNCPVFSTAVEANSNDLKTALADF